MNPPRHEGDEYLDHDHLTLLMQAIDRLEAGHQNLIETLARFEERLERHMTEEHKDFCEMVDVWRKAKGGALILKWVGGLIIGGVAAVAGAYSFLKDNVHITFK